MVGDGRFDIDALDGGEPFEIDSQQAHLYKHDGRSIDDIYELWESSPLFYPAVPPAHWLMVGEIGGVVLVVPLAPSATGDRSLCRPIGCYVASKHLADRYLEDR